MNGRLATLPLSVLFCLTALRAFSQNCVPYVPDATAFPTHVDSEGRSHLIVTHPDNSQEEFNTEWSAQWQIDSPWDLVGAHVPDRPSYFRACDGQFKSGTFEATFQWDIYAITLNINFDGLGKLRIHQSADNTEPINDGNPCTEQNPCIYDNFHYEFEYDYEIATGVLSFNLTPSHRHNLWPNPNGDLWEITADETALLEHTVPPVSLVLSLSNSTPVPSIATDRLVNPRFSIIDVSPTFSGVPDGEVVTLEVRVADVEANGGHKHTNTNTLRVGTFDVEPPIVLQRRPTTTCEVAGGECDHAIQFAVSEVSGSYQLAATVNSNPDVRGTASLDVGVPALRPLPKDDAYVLSGRTDTHPANHFGTDGLIQRIQRAARDYRAQTGHKLGINDMSLKRGGLFDICATRGGDWSVPHQSHRIGNSVDIDHCTDGNPDQPVDCGVVNSVMTAAGLKKVPEQSGLHYQLGKPFMRLEDEMVLACPGVDMEESPDKACVFQGPCN